MDPVEASVHIARPREEVFAYLADIANHPEFTDHYLREWRLLREETVGRGAGARYRIAAPFQRFSWADISFVEVEPPFRIIGVGRGGKYNRVKTFSSWTLHPTSGGTRVDYLTETEPKLLSDRFAEALGYRGWVKRQSDKGLRRLQRILEGEDEERGLRATVGGR